MAEQRKTWHGQAFDFEAVVDEQIAHWPASRRPALFRSAPPAEPPGRTIVTSGRRYGKTAQARAWGADNTRAAGTVTPELQRLVEAAPSNSGKNNKQDDKQDVRAAFLAFLEGATWTCARCDRPVERHTLKVPPPLLEDGRATFRMFCSSACAEG